MIDVSGIVFRKNAEAMAKKPRLIANKGGTRSAKTFSIMSLLVMIAMHSAGKDIDVVSESLPHLKRGALKDIETILDLMELMPDKDYTVNQTDKEYTFTATGSTIRFFSADNWGKVKGSRRDILFVNEANRIGWETYRQLAVRTTEIIFIDWNPDSEFWYEEKLLNMSPDTIEIKSTYKDNAFLTEEQIKEIERNRELDPEWWRVYGEGETGMPTGIIYKNFHVIDEIPDIVRRHSLHTRGLDFGYSSDPTSLVDIYTDEAARSVYCDELIYQVGMLNRDIAAEMKRQRLPQHIEIFADSAEPKSIDELCLYGFNVKHAYKKDLNSQIQYLKGFKIYITKRSLNGIKELRNYKWMVDRDGRTLNEPVDAWNHLLDALRYGVYTPLMGRIKPNMGKSTVMHLPNEQ